MLVVPYKLVHFEGLTIFLLLLMIILTLQRSTLWNLSLKSLQLFKFIKHLMIFKLVEKTKSFVLINGGEYNFLEFNKLYNEHGIQCQFFTFFTPSKHMGVFNKKTCILMESIHNMLQYTKLSNSFWEEVFTTSKNYLLRGNMVYSKLLSN